MMYFVVRARFLAGYSGREWPPSPARLFKALVAVSRHRVVGARPDDDIDGALRWLERQKPPTVLAARATALVPRLRRFVPNNSKVDPKTGEREWPASRKSKEPELIGGWRIDSPSEVAYAWSLPAGPEVDLLQAVARRIPSLGKGEDFVVAYAEHTVQLPKKLARYDPGHGGAGFTLEVPQEGCLSVCEEMFRRRAADPGWNRIHELPSMGTRLEPYVMHTNQLDRVGPPIALFGLWAGAGRRSFDARLLRVPVGQCRHLLSTMLDEAVADIANGPDQSEELLRLGQGLLCGHGPGGGKIVGPHAAVLALPSILGPYPDGRVRRLALVGFGSTNLMAAQLFEAVAARLHERELIDAGQTTGVVLRRETDAEWSSLLEGPATDWESVTPVVLERPEFVSKEWKRLGHRERGRDARRGDSAAAREMDRAIAERREALVREAISRLDVGDVTRVQITRAPWRAGLHPAPQYRASDYLRASPRFHIRVSFQAPVQGPIIVGRGKYVGFGLLRPLPPPTAQSPSPTRF